MKKNSLKSAVWEILGAEIRYSYHFELPNRLLLLPLFIYLIGFVCQFLTSGF
jgi:hypothetical protein